MRLLSEVRNLMGSYHVKSGIYHFCRNEFKQAVDFFRKALKDEPGLSDYDGRMARYYLTQTFVHSAERLAAKGDLEAAARDYRRALEVSPDFPDVRFRLGQTLENLEHCDEAVVEYRHAIRANGNYDAARTALAFCLLRLGRDEEALQAFREVLDLRMRRLTEPFERGSSKLREGMFAEAEELFAEAFHAAPARFDEHYKSALSLLQSEQWERALDELDRATALCPKFGDLHNFRGIALCELGRLEDGIAAFRRSLALNPDYQVAKLNLAFAYLRAGQFKDAENHLELVLEQDPTVTAASVKLEELRTGRATEPRRATPRGTLR